MLIFNISKHTNFHAAQLLFWFDLGDIPYDTFFVKV